MLFSGIPFLFYFLPCVLLLYFLSPKKLKNTVLLITSLVFYGWGEPKFLILMIASILIGYGSGLLIEAFSKKKKEKLAKTTLIFNVSVNLAFLGLFKYADFFIENFNAATGLSRPLLGLALPIGISFYTFQMLSYTVDVYRKTVPAQKNLIDLAAYISMFPQLIAGPIVRYADVEKQLKKRTHSFESFSCGMRRFIMGLGKKVLIANVLGELCDKFYVTQDPSVLFSWIYALAYCLHVYFDFSGYSDMAIGLGKMFGFSFMENFNYPFISKSATEFWRRWHISLGSWFRDYVYIPMGGNRVKLLRHLFNIFTVWLLTGFWHGAAWNFMIWGIYFAVLLILEKQLLLKFLDRSRVLSRVYLLFAVSISFVIFGAVDMTQAGNRIADMLGMGNLPLISAETLYQLRSFGLVLVLAILGATPLPKKIFNRLSQTQFMKNALVVLEPVGLVALLTVVTAYLVDGSFNPFLYFRF
ncbi:MAG: MBOAT family protein [Ruminococcaceae bacterium]|nr:MBOAT family protein [Oscillospiraceae bacterium]